MACDDVNECLLMDRLTYLVRGTCRRPRITKSPSSCPRECSWASRSPPWCASPLSWAARSTSPSVPRWRFAAAVARANSSPRRSSSTTSRMKSTAFFLFPFLLLQLDMAWKTKNGKVVTFLNRVRHGKEKKATTRLRENEADVFRRIVRIYLQKKAFYIPRAYSICTPCLWTSGALHRTIRDGEREQTHWSEAK